MDEAMTSCIRLALLPNITFELLHYIY